MSDQNVELTSSLEQLLEQHDTIRAIARGLVWDQASADDLVQDAMLDAARRAQSPASSEESHQRPWVRVISNMARARNRTDQRRRRRETVVARSEFQPSTADQVVAAEWERNLVAAVQELDDPYRTVVTLRYLEDLPPRDVVKQTGSTPEAVKKQLQRGLAQLRAKLESSMGPSQLWAILLVPLPERAVAALPVPMGKSLAMKYAAAGVGCAGLVAIGVHWLPLWTEPMTQQLATSVSVERGDGDGAELNDGSDLVLVTDGASATRTRPPSASLSPDAAAGGVAAARADEMVGAAPSARFAPSLRARVVDQYGEPFDSDVLNGLSLEFRYSELAARMHGEPTTIRLRPDPDGWIESGLVPSSPLLGLGRLVATAGGYSVLAIGFESAHSDESRVVLLPSVRVSGVVLSASGVPATDVMVSLSADLEVLGTYPGGLITHTSAAPGPVQSDASGRFDLGRVPRHARFTLYAGRPDTGNVRVSVPATDRTDLELRLEPPAPVASATVTGRVVTTGGEGLFGVTVHLGWLETRTGPDGRFQIEGAGDSLELIGENGHGLSAVTSDGRFDHADFDVGRLGPHILTIPDAMSALGARLVDGEGMPLQRVLVSVMDGTPLGSSSLTLENGPDVEAERTDADGHFELINLEPRPYSVRFIREDPFLAFDVEALVPGTQGIQIQVPLGHSVHRFRGRAVGVRGEPLAGLTVMPIAFPTENGGSRLAIEGASVLTDTDGWFELPHVPRAGAFLSLDPRPNDRREGSLVAVESLNLSASPEIALDLDCEVEPTLREGAIGGVLRFVDSEGRRVHVTQIVAGGSLRDEQVRQLDDGSFGLLLLPARTVQAEVLSAEGKLVRTVGLELTPMKRAIPEL